MLNAKASRALQIILREARRLGEKRVVQLYEKAGITAAFT